MAKDPRPNILVVLFDDAGFMDLGAYGGDARTPAIDTLAKEGVMFSRFYASPFCGPSRAMLLNWPYALGVMLALAAILSLAFWVARRLVCRVRTRALAAG
jgi:hypothetical protein